MNLFELFFGVGPAIQTLMQLGFLPKESDFLELTPSQYQKYFEQEEDDGQKVFTILPSNVNSPEFDNLDFKELVVVTEQEKQFILDGVQTIGRYCKDATYPLRTDSDKLRYAAARLPDVFSEGTPFANSSKLSVSQSLSEEDN